VAVLAVKTEPKCKICTSPAREEIDLVIERRSNREAGINLDYVLKFMEGCGLPNPVADNVTNHWKKHCVKTNSEGVAKAQEVAAVALSAIAAGKGDPLRVDDVLDRTIAIGMAEIEARLAAGKASGISPDIILRAVQEKTRRAHNETQSDLLAALGGGIAAALGQAAADKTYVKRIAPAEVVDAEAVEVS